MLGYIDKSDLIPKNSYLFSVTSVKTFESDKEKFFRKVLLKEEIEYFSKETILGTIVHYIIENVLTENIFDRKDILNYIDSYKEKVCFEDLEWVNNKYELMLEPLVSCFGNRFIKPKLTEHSMVHKIKDKIYLGGTIDCLENDGELIDFKTTQQLSQISNMPEHYKQQLYSYVYLLRNNNIDVNKISIQYIRVPRINEYSDKTGGKLKDYYFDSYKLTEYIDENYLNKIIDKINLIAEQLEYILNNPNSLYLFSENLNMKGLKWL